MIRRKKSQNRGKSASSKSSHIPTHNRKPATDFVTIFFDTSALVPVFDSDHVHHAPSLARFAKLPPDGTGNAYCSLHSLAEFYASTTRMPPPHRMEPDEALVAIDQVV